METTDDNMTVAERVCLVWLLTTSPEDPRQLGHLPGPDEGQRVRAAAPRGDRGQGEGAPGSAQTLHVTHSGAGSSGLSG